MISHPVLIHEIKTVGNLNVLSRSVCTFNKIVSIFISCLIMFLYAVNNADYFSNCPELMA